MSETDLLNEYIINLLNESYENSNVNIRVDLVHTHLTSYMPVNGSTDLYAI